MTRSCIDCELPFAVGDMSRRCTTCSVARYRLIQPQQQRAQAAVSAAVRKGVLARAATLACVDCGKPARHYDHRDYSQPLKVEPVCRSCNIKRGPADVWPKGHMPSDARAA
jgi:hypothetical protein